jgi:cytochrome c oxidase subunit IV
MDNPTTYSESPAPPDSNHSAPYGLYVLVWLSLLILTQFTVTAGQMRLGALGVIIALTVTPLKATLVLLFFMHLRYERPLLGAMFAFAVFSLAIAIGLTFSDYSFR